MMSRKPMSSVVCTLPLLLAACGQSLDRPAPGAHLTAPLAEPASAWKTATEPASRVVNIGLPAAPQPVPAVRPVRMASLGPAGLHHQMDGIASYYWQDQMTSSGERFDKTAMTAAHKTLPLGTRVRVVNPANGRVVVVRINDRGPFKPGRIIDLSEAAARELQITGAGLAKVRLDVVR